MPWKEVSLMSQRKEFVLLFTLPGTNKSLLCKRFGISRKTGQKWVQRYKADGDEGLRNQSRKPHHLPNKIDDKMEQHILTLRDQTGWGGRKLHRRLRDLGYRNVPQPSTISSILKRYGRITQASSDKRQAWQRFEHEAPNQLWQMDFKGHFALQQGRCHPLTVLDDHSRFSLCLQACENEQGKTVQEKLTGTFQRYGLPERMTMDNGSPWGSDSVHRYTPLTVWLIRLGIRVSHSRPYHPQTQGKDERFHRTLGDELLTRHTFHNLTHCQFHFNRWRHMYNLERPHEALNMEVPASRYQPSPRQFPETLPPIEYAPNCDVRKVQDKGYIYFQGRIFKISKAFKGYHVALQPTQLDDVYTVYFCHHQITQIDIREPL
jgi:transposase InsO family protein